jgi:RNA polymerase sigma factor (sigma-70 family)
VPDRQSTSSGPPARDELLRCLEESAQPLLDSIRVYVYRFALAQGDEASALAREIFQEVAVEAIAHADHFAPDRRPLPWLLGIALNIVRRRKVTDAKRASREILSSRFVAQGNESVATGKALEQTVDARALDQLARVEDDAEAEALLALVPRADQEVFRLAILEGWDRVGLAQQLGTSAVAARVRLHRAISRLRRAWFAREVDAGGEEHDGQKR